MSSTWEAAPERVRHLRNIRWDFTGEVVLITGAAQGQGRSHALAFAEAGADLVICDLPAGTRLAGITYDLGNPEKLAQVAKECRNRGARVVSVACDVRDSQQVQSMVQSAVAEYGKIDVLVNNAGLSGHHEVVDMPEAEWDDLINTNLRGVFLCSKYVAREMIKARKGKIISTASVLAFAAVPASAHYVVAKHGVSGLSKALAIELAPYGVTVNYVCPSAVNTEMAKIVFSDHVPDDYPERLAATSGSWNLLEEDQAPLDPTEVTYAVLFLASDAAKYITGAPVLVDAGFMTK
jgi:NAD(P)-dependent dehydrogenase (short-subunit alcohol dehydrogenase family)